MSDFARRLRQIREGKGVSLYRLAQLAGLSRQGALNLEEDGSDPKVSTVVKVADALGVDAGELMPGGKAGQGGQAPTTVDQRETRPDDAGSLPVFWRGDEGWFVTCDAGGGLLLVITPDAARAIAVMAVEDIRDVLRDLEVKEDISDEALHGAIERLDAVTLETCWLGGFGWLPETLVKTKIIRSAKEPFAWQAPEWWADFWLGAESIGEALKVLIERRRRRKGEPVRKDDWNEVRIAFEGFPTYVGERRLMDDDLADVLFGVNEE